MSSNVKGKQPARGRLGPNFESIIHKIGRVDTSDTVEDNNIA